MKKRLFSVYYISLSHFHRLQPATNSTDRCFGLAQSLDLRRR